MPEQILGNYRVESQLGAGGMGAVYQATDTRLGRQVAIKMLHEASLNDPERLARFEREARLLATLNHSNIAAIYGLEEAREVKFLVLEYVPGDTLAQRLAKARLPLKEVLDIGRQVADALAAAHEAGVIHRDLKPANIKITPEGKVKVLDFGLAKALEAARPGGTGAETATITPEMTQAGVVMGTAAYMSPEQASGKPVDRGTDIWAFGCVMYEALTGKRTFPGDTTTELLVGILDREPDWHALPADTPENVKRLLQRCLAKDLRSRLHDIADARLELEDTLAGRVATTVTVPRRRRAGTPLLAGVATGLAIGAIALGIWTWRSAVPAAPPRIVRFPIDLPPGQRIVPGWDTHFTFSRDSKTLLYLANATTGIVGLQERRLDDVESRLLPDRQGLRNPIYSPDGRWLATVDWNKTLLVKIPLSGGAPLPITPVEMLFNGDWDSDGYIHWTNQLIGAVIRTPENGGKNEPVTELDVARQERTHRYAKLLPGDKALIFTVGSGGIDSYDDARIDAFDLATKKRKPIVQGGTNPRYSPSGHIVYARAGSLFAVPFDTARLEATGMPVRVLDGVLMSINIGSAHFDNSPAGDLAYAAGPKENGERTLQWVDRQGKAAQLALPARSYLNPRISPDGKQLAVEVEGVNHNFYVYDFDRAVMTNMTNDGLSHAPIWTPDGKHIAYRSWGGEDDVVVDAGGPKRAARAPSHEARGLAAGRFVLAGRQVAGVLLDGIGQGRNLRAAGAGTEDPDLLRGRHGSGVAAGRERDLLSERHEDDGGRGEHPTLIPGRQAPVALGRRLHVQAELGLRHQGNDDDQLRRLARWPAVPDDQGKRSEDVRHEDRRGLELGRRVEAEDGRGRREEGLTT